MITRSLRALEVACWVAGVLLLAGWSIALIGGEAAKNRAIADFAQAQAAFVAPVSAYAPPLHAAPVVNASVEPRTDPIALLVIPRIAFEVPVFADTSERNLNRGAGWIEGTAAPGEYGNTGIAGHRDRYFRILKDVVVGDVVELDTVSQRRTYRVTRISVVKPGDNSSLRPTETDAVTLVTCYPFYYVGHAPKRYVVRAVEVSETAQAGNWPEPTAR